MDMIFEVRMDGSASVEQVTALAKEASANCFVENTLAKAIPLRTEVFLNEKKTLTLKRDPNLKMEEVAHNWNLGGLSGNS